MSDLASLIREKREREGLNLREAGAASGVAFSTLARVENGANPSLKVDRLIRHWLNGEIPLLPTPPMTLRDWFAGQALIGIMSTAGAFQRADRREGMVAAKAYEFADAMLAERAKGDAS